MSKNQTQVTLNFEQKITLKFQKKNNRKIQDDYFVVFVLEIKMKQKTKISEFPKYQSSAP